MSDIEGKAARGAASEWGNERVSTDGTDRAQRFAVVVAFLCSGDL